MAVSVSLYWGGAPFPFRPDPRFHLIAFALQNFCLAVAVIISFGKIFR